MVSSTTRVEDESRERGEPMKAQVSIRVASVVAGVALAGCASTDRDGFRGFTNVEGVDGGKRVKVEGVFEVTAPIAVRTDGGVVFESTTSRRDVVLTEWIDSGSADPRVTSRGGEFSMEFPPELLEDMSRLDPSNRRSSTTSDGGPKPQVRHWRANHVRVRTDGRGRWLVDAIDLSDGSESTYESTYSSHVEYDVSAR